MTRPFFCSQANKEPALQKALALGSMAIKNITRIGSETEGIF